jgi:DNA polymerase I-like protein with 3'-5' exonuclease and polymerase domains
MNTEAIFIDTEQELSQARDEILQHDVIGADTETTGLSAITDTMRLLQLSVSPSTCFVFDVFKLRDPSYFRFFRDILADPKKVVCFQNAKFDLQFLTAFFNEGPLPVELLYDTMLASKLLSFERRRITQKNGKSTWVDLNKHSLAEIVRRELEVTLDKELQKSDFSGEISQSQIEYAARDARILHNVRRVQKSKLIAHDLQKVVRLEGDAVAAIADLEYNGIYLDQDDWNTRIERQQARADELKGVILEALAPHVMEVDLFGDPVVNIDSPAQLLPLLRDFGVPIGDSTSEDELRPFMSEFPLVETLMEYRENATALKKFGPAYLKFITPKTGRIHADFHQMTAPSGRMSCVSEGTLVQVPGGEVPIETIQPGDFVYGYTSEGKLTLRKVLNVIDNGERECVDVIWKSTGAHDCGKLTVTPDHLIKLRTDGSWKQAGNLKTGERVYHLRRSKQERQDSSFRIKLYGSNYFQELEEHTIKREYFKANPKDHIHHRNEDPSDNSICNLEILTPKEHFVVHWNEERKAASLENIKKAQACRGESKFGEDNPRWIPISRFGLLRVIARTRGRLIYVGMDFNTFKRKCEMKGIDLKKVRSMYSKTGVYLSRTKIWKAFSIYQKVAETAQALGIGTPRLKRMCKEYGLSYNHEVVGVIPSGKYRVYDLEVEEIHNFIAGEVCVHNCSNPNLQQITQDPEYRHPFKAQNGGKIISADYGQIELRIMAAQSRDPGLVKAFTEGIHIHRQTCNLVFGEPLDNPDPHKYRLSKNLNFGATYGAGPPRFAQVAGIREEEASDALNRFWNAYSILDKYMTRRGIECAETGITRTHSGRMVKLLYDHQDRSAYGSAKRLGRNFGIQGTGADILKRAIYLMRNKAIKEKLDMKLVNLVHDETVTETNDDAELVGKCIKGVMVEAGQEVLDDIPCVVDIKAGETWTK